MGGSFAMCAWRVVLLLSVVVIVVCGVQSPCARVLLIVAHPDDETFFSGEALLGRRVAFPGGCRRIAWHVVCATNGDVDLRRDDFRRALAMAREHSVASEITEELWDYADCNLPYCEHFYDGDETPIVDRLSEVLRRRQWDFVVTHNPHGEYHHIQHVGLYRKVRRLLAETPGTRMLVFNPMPELNVSMSIGKRRMLQTYFVGPTPPARGPLFKALERYSEHLLPADGFTRIAPLVPIVFDAMMHGTASPHFSYAWLLARDADWGSVGAFSAAKAEHYVRGMLSEVQSAGCKPRGTQVPIYLEVCNRLKEVLAEPFDASGGGTKLWQFLEQMDKTPRKRGRNVSRLLGQAEATQ